MEQYYKNQQLIKIYIKQILEDLSKITGDNVSEDTLPELKKFVTQELDNFARKLNYSLKRFSK